MHCSLADLVSRTEPDLLGMRETMHACRRAGPFHGRSVLNETEGALMSWQKRIASRDVGDLLEWHRKQGKCSTIYEMLSIGEAASHRTDTHRHMVAERFRKVTPDPG